MISAELAEFMSVYLNVNVDVEETTRMMQDDLGPYVRPWLQPELDRVIAGPVLDLSEIVTLTGRDFASEAGVRAWLLELRHSWFGPA